MPSYGFLFRDERGADLVAYLESLHGTDTAQHLDQERAVATFCRRDSTGECELTASRLYQRRLRHLPQRGWSTRRAWQIELQTTSSELLDGPYLYLSSSDSQQQRIDRLVQIAKFGIPGTDMPGHEYLSEAGHCFHQPLVVAGHRAIDPQTINHRTLEKNNEEIRTRLLSCHTARDCCSGRRATSNLHYQSRYEPGGIHSGWQRAPRAGYIPCAERID